MATVKYFLPKGAQLSEEQKAELIALRDFNDPMDDPECPPMTDAQLDRMEFLMKKYKTRRLNKEMYIAERFIKPESK